jgi:hypothetical protein
MEALKPSETRTYAPGIERKCRKSTPLLAALVGNHYRSIVEVALPLASAPRA